jgi:hypothetical protein
MPIFDLQLNQQPMFKLLRAKDHDKRYHIVLAGHSVPSNLVAEDAIPWLD